MSDTQTVDAPIMLRADVTREDVTKLRVLALQQNKTTQALLGDIIRGYIERQAA